MEMDNIQNNDKFVTKKKTIMICEDEPDVLYSFELLLKSKYNIIMVDSGVTNYDFLMVYGQKKTVVICDDEQDLLQVFELALESEYNVILASSGEECIKKYIEELKRGNKIHLILLDYKLSDMMGDSVARKIKEHSGTNVILISAFNIDDDLIKELENGGYISRYILKPIETDSLTEKRS
jgi:CheY-like chemotaxis protein